MKLMFLSAALPSSVERVTSLIGELPSGCEAQPRPCPQLTRPKANERMHMLVRRCALALFASDE